MIGLLAGKFAYEILYKQQSIGTCSTFVVLTLNLQYIVTKWNTSAVLFYRYYKPSWLYQIHWSWSRVVDFFCFLCKSDCPMCIGDKCLAMLKNFPRGTIKYVLS